MGWQDVGWSASEMEIRHLSAQALSEAVAGEFGAPSDLKRSVPADHATCTALFRLLRAIASENLYSANRPITVLQVQPYLSFLCEDSVPWAAHADASLNMLRIRRFPCTLLHIIGSDIPSIAQNQVHRIQNKCSHFGSTCAECLCSLKADINPSLITQSNSERIASVCRKRNKTRRDPNKQA